MSIAELIERLEKATGPTYALDVDIFKFRWPEYADYIQGRGGLIHPMDGEDVRVPSNVRPGNYTASIDAALSLITLLPDANCWGIDKDERGVQAHVQRNGVSSGHWAQFAEHRSAAIALCIAILKAKQASEVAA